VADTDTQTDNDQTTAQKHATGPTSEQGKAKSRANSTTHGMSGHGDVLTPNQEEKVKQLYAEICTTCPPANTLECRVIRRIATTWVMLDACEDRLAVLYHQDSHRARFDWNTLVQTAVRQAIADMGRDPVQAIATLLDSPQGCLALADEWDALDGYLDKNGAWTAEQRNYALDLLGTSALRRDSRRTELDPRVGDGTTALRRARDVVQQQIAMLKKRAESGWLTRGDKYRQRFRILNAAVLDTREFRLAERYRAEQARRLQWWLNRLEKLQSAAGREKAAIGAAHAARLDSRRRAEAAAAAAQSRTKAETSAEKPDPEWAQATEKEMTLAEGLFRQYQAQKAAAQAAAASQPEPQVDPAVTAVLDNGPVIPASATPSPAPSPATGASSSSSSKPTPPTDKSVSHKQRREQESIERRAERLSRLFASASNGSPPA
jgi:hypothetical protein